MKKNHIQKGMTLIETLVYTAIFTMFVVTLASFANTTNSTRLRNQTTQEVNHQGSLVVRTMTQSIRNSVAINEPVISNSGTLISLQTSSSSTNPTIFYVATGTLYMIEASSTPVALTNNRVTIQDLVFSNLSRTSTPGTIRIRFDLKNADTLIKKEEQYIKKFYGTASIR